MRLIDADKVIEDITNTINEWIADMPDGEYLKGNVNFSVMARELVESQPTAYDVNKVVKELEETREKDIPRINNTTTTRDEKVYKLAMSYAIEIVKRGGIDVESQTKEQKEEER